MLQVLLTVLLFWCFYILCYKCFHGFVNLYSGNLTAAEFTDIAQQAALIPNFLADNYPSGFNLVDTADNLKAILTSTSSTIIAKDYIASISSNSDGAEKISLTWDEYIGALSGSNFSKTDSSTWSTLTSEIALKI